MAAHHRHVAGVVMHAVFLLVGGVVLFIDDDETEIGVGQKQRRARADHDGSLAAGDGAPGARAFARRQFRMPFRRPHPEARGEAVEELRGERDLRHQDQTLPAGADGVRHRLEIDLGLARAGDAVEQRHRIAAGSDRRFQRRRRGALIGAEFRLQKIGIGLFRDRLRRQHQRFQRAFVDQAVDHPGTDAGLAHGFALGARHAVGKKFEHALTCRGHALRRIAGEPDTDPLALGAEMLTHAQAHAQHHAARTHGIIRHPVDEAAQFGTKRRQFEFFLDIFQPVVEPDVGLGILRPHHRGRLARAERHADDVARCEVDPLRHPVGIGPVERDRDQNIDNPLWHRATVGRFRRV